MSLPNILTLARILAIPLIVGLLFVEGTNVRWVAFVIFTVAALTDYVDGYLARKMNTISPLGRMLDPIADKLLVGILLLAFAFMGSFDAALIWGAMIILAREIAVSGLREHLANQQVIIHASFVAKCKTSVQLVALGAIILVPALPGIYPVAAGLMWMAAALTIYSGYEYFVGAWPHLQETPAPSSRAPAPKESEK